MARLLVLAVVCLAALAQAAALAPTPAPAPAPSSSSMPTATVNGAAAFTCSGPGSAGYSVTTCSSGTYAGETVYCDPTPDSNSGYLIIGKDTHDSCTANSGCASGEVCDSYYLTEGTTAICSYAAPSVCF